jgi:phosphoribosylformimino-5-aminoimidazole carboxamide ribotide isomerase
MEERTSSLHEAIKMEFLVIPALDLKGGKCVQLVGGDPEKKLIEEDNPLEIAEYWESSGARRLHLIDLDGAIEGARLNEPIVRKIVEEIEIPIQFGGGIRTPEDAASLLELGVAKIIVGTIAVNNPKSLSPLSEKYGRERIIVALDSKDGKVVVKGWTERTGQRASEVVSEFEPYVSEVLFTNVDVEGRMAGFDEVLIQEVIDATNLGVLVSGGITTAEDIKKSRDLGAKGVVIGSALYTGKLQFEKARLLER